MKWQVNRIDEQAAAILAEQLRVSRVMAGLLVGRGLSAPDQARSFLSPSLADLPNPYLLPDMDRAVDRILLALAKQEQMTVYGDYDADGLTATALLADFLNTMGAQVGTYVPHRIKEGYGLNTAAVESLARAGTRLLITVDCGVSDFEAVTRANELGLDVIVTDHHQIPPRLPPALAVINPHRTDSRFPQRQLAGVGVAFFLAGGLRQRLRENGSTTRANQPELAPLLGFVAIGSVADVVPLTKINRILVSVGLAHLASPIYPGLVALKEVSAVEAGRPPTARDVAFRLAPRLNAVGRLGSPLPGLELLLTRNHEQARGQADSLEKLNSERRRLQDETVRQAEEMLENLGTESGKIIVLAREGWRRGVVGLAASKLTERFRKPAILLVLEDDRAVGSGRSVEGFNLFRALDRCRDLLDRFGGHEQAAGMSLPASQVPALAQALFDIADLEIDEEELKPVLNVDAWVTLEDLGQLQLELPRLAPFGQGNPEPVLALQGLTTISAGGVGSNHLRLTLGQNGRTLDTIAFNQGHLLPELGPRVAAALQRHTSTYRGQTVQGWKVVDIKKDGNAR